MLKKIYITTIFYVLFSLLPAYSQHEKHDSHEEYVQAKVSKYGHLTTFGPEEAPHFHKIDLTKFKKISDIAKNPAQLPPPLKRDYSTTVKISLVVKEVISEIAPGITYHYWTFNETVPGPFFRIREKDTVELTITNDTSSRHNHSIDLHAVTGPGGGSVLTEVKPGETKKFRFKALKPGLFVYHCATGNVPMHMTSGLYGLILVEPEGGLPEVDKEFYVMQGELYTKGKIGEKGFQEFDAEKMLYEKPEYVIFNGRVKALADHPLQAKVGDKIRLYIGNAGVSLVSSFHLIGEILDTVYPEASVSTTIKNIQTTVIPAGGATIIELELDVPGKYILLDHSISRIDKGAWGLLEVSGPMNPGIYSKMK